MAFDPAGDILAFTAPGNSGNQVHLINPRTRGLIAKIEAPNPRLIHDLEFSADGSRLAVARSDRSIQLWDLRKIRRRLSTMSLDWDLPPYPPEDPRPPEPLRVEIVLVDRVFADPVQDLSRATDPKGAAGFVQRARAFQQRRAWPQAIADYLKALELEPENLEALNGLAWAYATGPAEVRDPRSALPLIEKVLSLRPGEHRYLNTLGVVGYRLGSYTEALDVLIGATEGGEQAWDWFFAAMSCQRLGLKSLAHHYYKRARQWIEAQAQLDPLDQEDLKALRAEAEEVLELKPAGNP